ncbi:hypothetical protein Pcinc_038883 [Petrolisthes cinctipes]|uniref:Uncharacterized protein n=1 Tax=Petrolisthes cinctipes TaxID=88211 RepID=A0AAE1BQI9_PETCI|nr:hypothetical protein Pcinc_038883 [Petrolisthes cinctipes]
MSLLSPPHKHQQQLHHQGNNTVTWTGVGTGVKSPAKSVFQHRDSGAKIYTLLTSSGKTLKLDSGKVKSASEGLEHDSEGIKPAFPESRSSWGEVGGTWGVLDSRHDAGESYKRRAIKLGSEARHTSQKKPTGQGDVLEGGRRGKTERKEGEKKDDRGKQNRGKRRREKDRDKNQDSEVGDNMDEQESKKWRKREQENRDNGSGKKREGKEHRREIEQALSTTSSSSSSSHSSQGATKGDLLGAGPNRAAEGGSRVERVWEPQPGYGGLLKEEHTHKGTPPRKQRHQAKTHEQR